MAKDDYFVIVYRILAYLYMQLKKGECIDREMIDAQGQLFCIHPSYWLYIMEHMLGEGYIEGLRVQKTWGRDVVITGWDHLRITPKGIGYLCDNSFIEKAKEFLREIKEITPFI
ncbi:MAG: YjcQ family protein [Peptostreptococcaceae bacterium]|nr:YjcQ family protein [Peptostreptococcaceae bacterium]